jgi:Cof subfamily protein (haloacid dehalogenase superfamily)
MANGRTAKHISDTHITREFANGLRLIASDLDGTLLRDHASFSPQVADAIAAAHAAGIEIVAATGRDLAGLPEALAATEVDYVVASNGALGCRLSDEQVFFADHLPSAVQVKVSQFLVARFPGTTFAAVRGHGETFFAEPAYAEIVADDKFFKGRRIACGRDLAEVTAEPVLKLAARCVDADPDDLLDALSASGITGFHATTSGAPFVEISAVGVTKASGLSKICAHLGIAPSQVAAIGDAKNDIEMIEWAGLGIAMGNSVPETKAAADAITESNQSDGLALAIAAILARRS